MQVYVLFSDSIAETLHVGVSFVRTRRMHAVTYEENSTAAKQTVNYLGLAGAEACHRFYQRGRGR